MDVDTGQKIMLLHISIILSVLVFVNANHKQCYEEQDGDIIEKAYDPSTHICCGGFVIRKNGIDKACCSGKTVFDRRLEICCGDKTDKRTTQKGQNNGCCGNTTYVTDGSKVCCGNKILYTSTGDNEGCCGEVKVDTSRQRCCVDELYNTAIHSIQSNHDCCGTVYFNMASHTCKRENDVVPIETAHDEMCGGTEYNAKLQSCCHGKINMEPWKENDACCGSRKYNMLYEKCCNEKSGHVIASDYMCCGSGFATRSQRCCQNQVINVTTTTQMCCGHNLFDPENGEGCCRTSQNGVYDKSTMKCCNGNIVPKDAGCCGDRTYNQATSVCCNDDYAIPKLERDHNRCCSVGSGEGKSYNNATDRCIERYGVAIVEPRTTMCGSKKFYPDRDLCCGMELYSNAKRSGLKCCIPGTKAFDPSIELCCNSVVYSRSVINSCDDVDTIDEDAVDEYDYDGYGDINGNDVIGDDDDDTENEGMCQICRMDASEATRKIKRGEIDVCYNNANKFNVRKERPSKQYQFLGMNMVNFYGGKKLRQPQRVHIPCNCRINWKQVIIITDKPSRKNKLFLDERDIVLPYTREVKRQIRKVHKSKCKHKTDVKELLNDLKVYLLQIQLKVDKLENKVVKKS